MRKSLTLNEKDKNQLKSEEGKILAFVKYLLNYENLTYLTKIVEFRTKAEISARWNQSPN